MVTLLGARAHFMINWLIWLELEAEHRCELCTNIAPVRSYARTLQNIKWWGLGKMLEHRCGLCTTIAPVRSYAHAHIIPPDTRSEEGATPTHRHYGPAPVLTATPGLAQISGDPAWLTQGTLPPPLPPYLTLSRHLRRSKVQNTARFGGIKTKLQGHSQ